MALLYSDYSRLNIVVDMVGKCFGTCPGCLLTLEERASDDLFLSIGDIEKALSEVKSKIGIIENAALFLGRGDVLGLGKEGISKIVLLKPILLDFINTCKISNLTLEIATSLIGNQEDYKRNAEVLIKAFEGLNINIRFVVITNLSIDVLSYNEKIRSFLDHTSGIRGGGDNSGDIININLSPFHLPEISSIKKMLDGIYSPVNLIWAYNPSQEQKLTSDILLMANKFILELSALMVNLGSDFNVRNIWGAIEADDIGAIGELMAKEEKRESFYVINKSGSVNGGFFTLLGDFDTERLGVKNTFRGRVLKALQHPACRVCEWAGVCTSSGAINFASMNLAACSDIKDGQCPSCLKDTFSYFRNVEQCNV